MEGILAYKYVLLTMFKSLLTCNTKISKPWLNITLC